LADAVTALSRQVKNEPHESFVVLACALGHVLAISLACLVLPEKPIDGAIARDAFDRLAVLDFQPLIKQAVERGSATAYAVETAGSGVVIAKRFVGYRASQLPVAGRDREIECSVAVGQPLGDYVAGQLQCHGHKSSARSRGTARSGGRIA
jgi:hypothetical protein